MCSTLSLVRLETIERANRRATCVTNFSSLSTDETILQYTNFPFQRQSAFTANPKSTLHHITTKF